MVSGMVIAASTFGRCTNPAGNTTEHKSVNPVRPAPPGRHPSSDSIH